MLLSEHLFYTKHWLNKYTDLVTDLFGGAGRITVTSLAVGILKSKKLNF